MTREQRIAEKKADRELMNHIYDIRRQLDKEYAGMSLSERIAHTNATAKKALQEHGVPMLGIEA